MSPAHMNEATPRARRSARAGRLVAVGCLALAAFGPGLLAAPRSGANAPSRTAVSAREPLSLTDLTRLVREGVGGSVVARQIRRSGLDFEPTVEALLQLRRAGASDEVLEAVLDATERGSQPATGAESGPGTVARAKPGPAAVDKSVIRMYEGSDSHGRPTLVLTNLDEDGQRLGGEAEIHQAPNVVLSPERSQPGSGAWADESDAPPQVDRRGTRRHARIWRDGSDPDAAGADPADATDPASPVTVIIENGAGNPAPGTVPATCGGVYPWSGCGVVATGGIEGGFKYPDHLFFLGYDPRNAPKLTPPPMVARPPQPPPKPHE